MQKQKNGDNLEINSPQQISLWVASIWLISTTDSEPPK